MVREPSCYKNKKNWSTREKITKITAADNAENTTGPDNAHAQRKQFNVDFVGKEDTIRKCATCQKVTARSQSVIISRRRQLGL